MLIENTLRFYDDIQISLARLKELIALSEVSTSTPEYVDALTTFLKSLYDSCPLFTISSDSFKNDLKSLEKELEGLLSIINKEALLQLKNSLFEEKQIKNVDEEETELIKQTLFLGADGEVLHCPDINLDEYYCDSCSYLRFCSNPDPYDPFRWSDEDAVCSKMKQVISERRSVMHMDKITKPAFCPKKVTKK